MVSSFPERLKAASSKVLIRGIRAVKAGSKYLVRRLGRYQKFPWWHTGLNCVYRRQKGAPKTGVEEAVGHAYCINYLTLNPCINLERKLKMSQMIWDILYLPCAQKKMNFSLTRDSAFCYSLFSEGHPPILATNTPNFLRQSCLVTYLLQYEHFLRFVSHLLRLLLLPASPVSIILRKLD